MEENKNIIQEEGGLDVMAMLRTIWGAKKIVFISLGVATVLGLVAALTMKRTYTVSTVLVPQMKSKNNSLGSLAALAGFDIGTSISTQDLSPLVYPQIVESVPFRLELMNAPVHYAKVDTAVSMYTYLTEIAKPSVLQVVKKYTIGLPFLILSKMQKEKPDVVLPASVSDDDTPKPLVLTKKQAKMVKYIGECVNLMVEKKEGYLTLTVKGSEPIQTAELATKAQALLQREVTRFRTEKAQSELDYIQGRYDEIKKECEDYQYQLATVSDRTKNMTSSRSQLERDRIQSKYNTTNAVYMEMAKQLEQAKMTVKKDTPVFTVVKPVTVPTKPSNSRAKKLAVWMFLGLLVGCAIPLGKEYWPVLKAKFQGEVKDETHVS